MQRERKEAPLRGVGPIEVEFKGSSEFHANLPIIITLMADLHDDVTYEGWGKSSTAGHRECMGNSECVLRRSFSLLRGKTDRLLALIFATQRVGVFISESDGCIDLIQGVWLQG